MNTKCILNYFMKVRQQTQTKNKSSSKMENITDIHFVLNLSVSTQQVKGSIFLACTLSHSLSLSLSMRVKSNVIVVLIITKGKLWAGSSSTTATTMSV